MTPNPVTYPESAYRIEIVPETLEDGRLIYVAWHPEIRRVHSQGASPEEARENLSDAFSMFVEHCIEHGFDMPSPQQSGVKEIIWRSLSISQAQVTSTAQQPLPSMRVSQVGVESPMATLKGKG